MNEKYTKRTTIEGTEESEYFTGCLILLRSRTSFPLPARRTLTNCSHLGQLARSLAFSHHFSLLVLHRFGSGTPRSAMRNKTENVRNVQGIRELQVQEQIDSWVGVHMPPGRWAKRKTCPIIPTALPCSLENGTAASAHTNCPTTRHH